MTHKINTDDLIEATKTFQNILGKIAKIRQEIENTISLMTHVNHIENKNMTFSEYGREHQKIVEAVGTLPDINDLKAYLTHLDKTIQILKNEREYIDEVIQVDKKLKQMFGEFL